MERELLTPEEYTKQRKSMGCVAVARRIHMMLAHKPHVQCVLDDVAFLQSKLIEWRIDGDTPYGKAAKQLVLAAISEAARDERLTFTETAGTMVGVYHCGLE